MSRYLSAIIIEVDDDPMSDGYDVSFYVNPTESVPIAWLPPGTHVDQVAGQVLGALADVVRGNLGWPEDEPKDGWTG